MLCYAKSLQLCPSLCDPKDSSPPGSPSLGFSRQEHWSGLPFPSSIQVVQSCPTSSDPMDCSPPGFSIHGILQARALEWVAIALSNLLSTSSYVSYTCDYIVIHAAFLSLFLIFLNPVCAGEGRGATITDRYVHQSVECQYKSQFLVAEGKCMTWY